MKGHDVTAPNIEATPSREGMKILSLDSETYPIERGRIAPPLVCVSYCEQLDINDPEDVDADVLHRMDGRTFDLLHAALTSKDYLIIGANIVFDLAVWASWDRRLLLPIFIALEESRIEDIQTRQKLIDVACGTRTPNTSYKLQELERRYFNIDRSEEKDNPDAWRTRYHELDQVPVSDWPTEAYDYAVKDAVHPYMIYLEQAKQEHLLDDSFRQQRAHMGLQLMSCRGIVTDPEAHALYERYTRARLNKNRSWLIREGLVKEVRKPTKTQKEKGVPPPWFKREMKKAKARMEEIHPQCKRTAPSTKHPDGQPSLDADAVLEAGDPLLIAYQEFGSAGTILTNLEDLRLGFNGGVHTGYEILKDTGRTGSFSPNMQNRRKEFGDRECVIPREGWTFAQADYSGLELHTFAQFCVWTFGYSDMADALNRGDDVHLVMASTILGISFEQATHRYAAGDPEVKTARALAKIANFGFGGGMGPVATVVQARAKHKVLICGGGPSHEPYGVCKACVDRARKLREEWKATWREAAEYLDRYIPGLFSGGRDFTSVVHPYSNRHRGRLTYTQTANTYFQGLGSDAAKQGLWDLTVACYVDTDHILYGCRPVLFVHDENIVEIPYLTDRDKERAHDRAIALEEVMCAGANLWLPDCPVTAPPLLMARWSKDAKAVHDPETGKLVPWDVDVRAKFGEICHEEGLSW